MINRKGGELGETSGEQHPGPVVKDPCPLVPPARIWGGRCWPRPCVAQSAQQPIPPAQPPSAARTSRHEARPAVPEQPMPGSPRAPRRGRGCGTNLDRWRDWDARLGGTRSQRGELGQPRALVRGAGSGGGRSLGGNRSSAHSTPFPPCSSCAPCTTAPLPPRARTRPCFAVQRRLIPGLHPPLVFALL